MSINDTFYSIAVDSSSSTNGSISIGGNFTGDIWGTGGTWWTWPNTNYFASTIFMYELKCPRCKTRNWGQIDAIVSCKKCTAKLKAVSQEVDFEIPVG